MERVQYVIKHVKQQKSVIGQQSAVQFEYLAEREMSDIISSEVRETFNQTECNI